MEVLSGPLLEGELAQRAESHLDALSRTLAYGPSEPYADPTFAFGSAGMAVVHAHLHARYPDRGHDRLGGDAIEHAMAAIGTAKLTPWLFQGLAGIGWAMRHLSDPEAADPAAPFDARFVKLLESGAPLPAELMHGLAGLVVHGLARADRSEALLGRATERLLAKAVLADDAPAIDFGLGHGTPGILAALASVALAGHPAAGSAARDVLAQACRALLARRLPAAAGTAFASTSKSTGPSRSAWCYGDPGAVWGVLLAARALEDQALVDEAVTIAERAAERSFGPSSVTGTTELSVCHGGAGLAHLFHQLARETGSRALADAARAWVARTIDGSLAVLDGDSSLLTGLGGVALVLSSALDDEALRWDEPLLVRPPAVAQASPPQSPPPP